MRAGGGVPCRGVPRAPQRAQRASCRAARLRPPPRGGGRLAPHTRLPCHQQRSPRRPGLPLPGVHPLCWSSLGLGRRTVPACADSYDVFSIGLGWLITVNAWRCPLFQRQGKACFPANMAASGGQADTRGPSVEASVTSHQVAPTWREIQGFAWSPKESGRSDVVSFSSLFILCIRQSKRASIGHVLRSPFFFLCNNQC